MGLSEDRGENSEKSQKFFSEVELIAKGEKIQSSGSFPPSVLPRRTQAAGGATKLCLLEVADLVESYATVAFRPHLVLVTPFFKAAVDSILSANAESG